MKEIFERTNVVAFKNQLVEPQKITLLLKAAMAAPSEGDQRPWEFYGVRNKIKLLRLAVCAPQAHCVKDAPFAIVACARRDAQYPELVPMDMSNAVENMLLAAVGMDLGAVAIAVAPYDDRMAEVAKVLSLPDDVTPFAIVPVGYPAATAPKIPVSYDPTRVHFLN